MRIVFAHVDEEVAQKGIDPAETRPAVQGFVHVRTFDQTRLGNFQRMCAHHAAMRHQEGAGESQDRLKEYQKSDEPTAFEDGVEHPVRAFVFDLDRLFVAARRIGERRVFRLDQLQPPIAPLLQLQAVVPALGVKVMPSVQDAELPGGCGVEFISHQGICKEAVLWFGPARWQHKWATIIQDGDAEHILSDDEAPPLGELVPGQLLYEPDPALIRAGCLAWLCRRLNAHLFDPEIAYLVGTAGGGPGPNHPVHTHVQAFAIEEIHPFALKLLNQRLQALGVARVELKKRGFPVEPEALRPRLKLARQGRDAVVIFTRVVARSGSSHGDEHLMLIGRRLGGE